MRQAEYCDWITNASNWGGEIEICMMCEVYLLKASNFVHFN